MVIFKDKRGRPGMISYNDGANGRVLPTKSTVGPEALHLPERSLFCKFAMCTLRNKY